MLQLQNPLHHVIFRSEKNVEKTSNYDAFRRRAEATIKADRVILCCLASRSISSIWLFRAVILKRSECFRRQYRFYNEPFPDMADVMEGVSDCKQDELHENGPRKTQSIEILSKGGSLPMTIVESIEKFLINDIFCLCLTESLFELTDLLF